MKIYVIIIFGCILCGLSACGSMNRQIKTISENNLTASLELPPEPALEEMRDAADSVVFADIAGATYIMMRAEKDESGDMVASETISAAKVTARFRNVAERLGQVLLQFEITIPEDLLHEAWQLRFYPKMRAGGAEELFPPLFVTGYGYRQWQLRGLGLYDELLRRIDRDSTKIVSDRLLGIFLQRHTPSISDSVALDHYTRGWMKDLINHKQQRAASLLERVRFAENVKADTVVAAGCGSFTYSYEQTVCVKDDWRKLGVVVDGEIFVENERIYSIGASDSLTFYISSLRDFLEVDGCGSDAVAGECVLEYNAAVTALCAEKNHTALKILSELERDGKVEDRSAGGTEAGAGLTDLERGLQANVRYLKAVAYSRIGDDASAVAEFVAACRLKPSFIHRGNLDPEIAYLITKYHLSELF